MKNKNADNKLTLPRLTDPALWARISGQAKALLADKAFHAKLKAAAPPGKPPEALLHEYLRFAYLAWTGNTSATPSEVVDRAWHAHILCTRSYAAFCEATTGRLLHHDPGSGDENEKKGFAQAYLETLGRYESEFGTPPGAFWPRPRAITQAKQNPSRSFTALAGLWTLSAGLIAGATLLHLGGSWPQVAFMAGFASIAGLVTFAMMGSAASPTRRPGKNASNQTSSSGGDATPALMASTGCSDGGAGDGGGSSCGGGGCGS